MDLVVIETPNCPEICQVFADMGVKHVIYFKVSEDFCKNKLGSQDNDAIVEEEVLYQHKHNVVKQFMKEFSTNLYPLIVGSKVGNTSKKSKSIKAAVEAAEKMAKQRLESLD